MLLVWAPPRLDGQRMCSLRLSSGRELRSVANKIGISVRYKAEVELADGRVIQRDVSEAVAELNGSANTIPLLIGPKAKSRF